MTSQGETRRLAAILAADVVGYSRLMGADEAGTLARLKAHRGELTDPKFAAHRGRIVKTTGDGVLVEFPSVVGAVQCAVEIQREMAERNADAPTERRIEFRIGINLGDIIIDGDDIYGDGVNVAARLEGLAEPGGICISGTAFDQVRNKLEVGFEDLGPKEVKNIAEPVRTYAVRLEPEAAGTVTAAKKAKPRRWRWAVAAAVAVILLGGAAVWNFYPRPPTIEPASREKFAFPLPDKPSIAVLPFANMSGDPEQDYFSDGLTETLITELARIPSLFVIARNSTFVYKKKPVKIRQVAEDLGVQYVLEGSVQKAGDRVRINAQLIDALKGNHLWAERYDRPIKDTFVVQDEITRKIVTVIKGKVQFRIRNQATRGIATAEGLEYFFRGFAHLIRLTKEDNALAREMFLKVVKLEPKWPLGWVLLGRTHRLDFQFRWSKDPRRSFERSAELAEKALALDDTDPGANSLLGNTYLNKREHEKAIAYGRKSVALAPNSSPLKVLLAQTLNYSGQPEEAVGLIREAMRLNPRYPVYFLFNLGQAYRLSGQFDKAIDVFKEALVRNPRAHRPRLWLAIAYSQKGEYEKAREEVEKVLRSGSKYSATSYAKTSPFQDPADLKRDLDALRKAGLPENPPLPLPAKPSIAVMPFANLSNDKEQEYFADGITEDIITDLSKISGLFVVARNSTFTYKGKTVKVRRIAEELGVRYVLEGSLRRAGNRVRINAQLIDATTGGHLWAERYDHKVDDIFALQDAITGKVVQALELHLTKTDRDRRSQETKTVNPEAYDLVLRARKLLTRFDHQAAEQARDLLNRAIKLDPDYAEPYSLLGLYHFDAWRLWGENPEENLKRALELGHTAVKLSPMDPAPHVLLAQAHQFRREFDAASKEADAALALKPNDAVTLANLGSMLRYGHRPKEAAELIERAIRLDPYHPPNYLEWLGDAYLFLGRPDDCAKAVERGIALEPDFIALHVVAAKCYGALGDEKKARRAGAEVLRIAPGFTLSAFASYVPFTDKADLQLNLEVLRKAGLPE